MPTANGLKTNLFKLEALLKKIETQSTTCANQMDNMAAPIDLNITL